MPKTISFHCGSNWSRGHNIRDERYTNKQEHIDKVLTQQNVTVRDVPVRQAYAEIFGQAVEEYNAKQQRSDRRITDYYDKIKQNKRKHPVYECIVQIGDRSDTGNAAEQEKQALIRFAEEWDKNNPNLKLVGAYIHADEPNGTVHMHIDFIPVAKCNRGMALQNSFAKALEQQGFKGVKASETAQMKWQQAQREILEQLCADHQIEAKANQGLTHIHLSSEEYQRAKERQKQEISQQLAPLKAELDDYKQLKVDTESVVLEKKKVPLSKNVMVSAEKLEKTEQQAAAYVANRDEIEDIRARQAALDEAEQQLIAQQRQLQAYEQKKKKEIAEKEKELASQKAQYQAAYDQQLDLNGYVERLEYSISLKDKEIRSLTDENGSLRRSNKQLNNEALNEKESVIKAYSRLTDVLQAVNMLCDKNSGYYAALPSECLDLLTAITECSKQWVIEERLPKLSNEMWKADISPEIQGELDEISPPDLSYHHHYGR